MRASISWVLLSVVFVTGRSFGQPATDKGVPTVPPADKGLAAKRTLDEQLAAALRHSPDIQVAEAKVREAQAELRRTRLTVLQRVIDTSATVEAARVAAAHAEATFARVSHMVQAGQAPCEEVEAAEAKLAAAKAQRALAESCAMA